MIIPRAPRKNTSSRDASPQKALTSCPVAEALYQSSHRGLDRVSCEFREGLAILHGKVSSYYLKQLAQEIAKRENAVELVINRVEVKSP